jgi:hypothetical protein
MPGNRGSPDRNRASRLSRISVLTGFSTWPAARNPASVVIKGRADVEGLAV